MWWVQEEAGREVLREVASELTHGRIDAGTAISIVERILGSPALTQLSAVLEAQAQELLAAAAAAPAAQALSWALASALAPASAAPPALPLQALLQAHAQHAQRAPQAAQSASWDAAASALASGQQAGGPIHHCGTASPATMTSWLSGGSASLSPSQAAGSRLEQGQVTTRAGAAGGFAVLPGRGTATSDGRWGSPRGPTAHDLVSVVCHMPLLRTPCCNTRLCEVLLLQGPCPGRQ